MNDLLTYLIYGLSPHEVRMLGQFYRAKVSHPLVTSLVPDTHTTNNRARQAPVVLSNQTSE